jgi:hypothetical protein
MRSKAAYAWVTGSTLAAYRVAALMLPSRLWFCRASNPAQGFRVDPHNIAQRARDRPPQRAGGAGGSSGRQPFQGCPIRLSLPETMEERNRPGCAPSGSKIARSVRYRPLTVQRISRPMALPAELYQRHHLRDQSLARRPSRAFESRSRR